MECQQNATLNIREYQTEPFYQYNIKLFNVLMFECILINFIRYNFQLSTSTT